MMRNPSHTIRLYWAQARIAYQGRFAITHPLGYIAGKLGFPFFMMLFFIFMGKFVGFNNPVFIVIGNVLLIPASSGMFGITLAVGEERNWGTLSYLLGSPAPRLPLFLGRALFFILDGFLTCLLGFAIAAGIFHLDVSSINFPILLLSLLLVTLSSCGMGFIFGSFSLVSRDAWVFLNTFISLLWILIGVNFPMDALPGFLQKVGWWLPLTRGILAARQALNGAGWSSVGSLLLGEIGVGAVYLLLGYLWFRLIERRSLATGTLDAM